MSSHHLHGVVLAVTPSRGEAIIRHDAFDSMPAMSMPFRIVPRSALSHLRAGDVIEGTADTSTDPWSLRDISIRSKTSLLQDELIHNVPLLALGDTLPSTPFVDEHGKAFTFDALRGRRVVLAFIYTRCRDPRMCPLISAKFGALQRAIGDRAVRLVEVTLDPSFDRPDVLARYGRAFGADFAKWTMLTGDPNTVLDFAARFGITTFDDAKFGIIHSERTAVIDPAGRIDDLIDTTAWQPSDIVAQIDAENGRASNPLERLNLYLSSAATAVCGNRVGGFSGLADLGIVLVIVLALAYVLVRLARKIFAENV